MKKSNSLYYIGIFLVFFINLADISKVINIDGTLRDVVYILIAGVLIIKILTSRLFKKEIIPIIVLGIINLYTSYILNNYMFVINFLSMIAIRDIEIKKVVKIDLYLKLFYLFVNTVVYWYDYNFNYANVIDTFVYTAKYGIRHSLYFSHPNSAAGVAIWCAIDAIYLYDKKKNMLILTLFIVALYMYFTVSRTALIAFILFLIILFLSNKEKFRNKIFTVMKWLLEIFMIITIILTIMPEVIGNQEFIKSLDKLLSRRISYSNTAYDIYGFNVLPNKDGESLKENLIIDNFYVRAIISYGIIAVIVLMIMYKKIDKNITNKELAILTIFPIYLFSELFTYNVGRSIAMLILADVIFNKRSTLNERTD